MLDRLALQTSKESIDNSRAQRDELKRRIQSLLKVRDPHLLEVRDKTISLIQHGIDKYYALPDDNVGK